MVKKETPKALIFSADLEMTRISKYSVRYRVKNKEGFGLLGGLAHVEFERKNFPNDDDFSMEFINLDLAQRARTGDQDNPAGVAKLLQKQAGFRKLKNFKLYIEEE